MKTTSLHIAFAALLSLLLLASCSRNDEVAVAEGEEGKVQVTFTLKLDNESSASRAMSRAEDNTWGDEYNYDLGNDYDNRINDLQVVIYEGNTFKCKVTNLSFYKNEEKNEYTYLGSISETLTANTEYKIMVFANCADWANITSKTNLSDLSYTYNENMGIPMWGVITQTLSLVPGSRQELDDISLLRAFAKVEVSMNVEGYTLQSVSIDNSNKQGYCLPKDYTLVGNTTDLDREEDTEITTFNPYKDSEKIEDRTFTNENGTYYIYLPEYNNSTNAAKIQVTVKNNTTNEEKPYDLEFKDYVNGAPTGDPYDIVRNHIYRYTITGVNDGKLVIQYRAMPWELVTSEIGYAPQPISTNSNPFADLTGKWEETAIAKGDYYILLPRNSYNEDDRNTTYQLLSYLYENPDKGDDDARYCILTKPTYVDDEHRILKTGSAGARYFFLLTGPEGATWKAHLTNEEDFYFSTSTVSDFNHSAEYGNDNDGKVNMVSHGIARAKPYIIQINVRHSWTGVSEDAEGIAVDASGSVTGEYLWYLDEDYLYVEDGDTKSHVDDISDEKDSWWDSDKRDAFWATYDYGDNSLLKNAFSYFTEWGEDMDEKKDLSLISTDFYITVTLADGAEYELKINPPYEYLDASNKTDTRYKDNRRFAGTDERIWIRHVPAQYMWGYDDLASPELNQHQENAGQTEKYWWQVNESWK